MFSKFRSFAPFILCCFPALVAPQGPSKAPDDRPPRIDKVFEKYNRTDSPGCAVSVMKDGGIVYKHGYGMANLDYNITIAPSTVFHVASVSKQFTAASVLLLAQQGKLSLDDDVRKYIPELPDFGSTITIRQLIHHTSGLRDQWSLLGLAGWRYSLDLITDGDVMSLVTRQKDLNFKPGEKHVYCNTGYTLLAQIVKRVSGVSFREFTTKTIFEPLGMNSTHFRDDHAEIIKNNAYGYQRDNDSAPFRLSVTNFDTVGATSLHTTVEDLALWDENFYHPRVGGPAFIEQMLQRGQLNSGEQLDYASGLVHGSYKGLRTVDHGGADAGYRSALVRFPDQHFSVAALCNLASTDPSGLARQVADVFLAQQMKTVGPENSTDSAVVLTEQQLAAFAALYWFRDGDQFLRVFLKDGRLHASFNEVDEFVLKPASSTLFHLDGPSFGDSVNLRFVPDARGRPGQLLNSYMDQKPDTFEVTSSFTPTASDLAAYAGNYVSAEIDPVYGVAVKDGRLTLSRLKHEPATLHPQVRDVFSSEIGNIHFVRDSKQRVSGFTLNSGRIRGFRFSRRPD